MVEPERATAAETDAVADGTAVEAAKAQVPVKTVKPEFTQQTLAVIEPKMPEELKKALEQVPVLAAKVAEQQAEIARLSKERTGSKALVAETPAGAETTSLNKQDDPWFSRGADIFEIARREREARSNARK